WGLDGVRSKRFAATSAPQVWRRWSAMDDSSCAVTLAPVDGEDGGRGEERSLRRHGAHGEQSCVLEIATIGLFEFRDTPKAYSPSRTRLFGLAYQKNLRDSVTPR